MERLSPFWSTIQQQTYMEVALLVCAKGEEERLTPRNIAQRLSPEALEFARQLPHGHDETFGETLMSDVEEFDIAKYEESTGQFKLGMMGNMLVIGFLEEWAG